MNFIERALDWIINQIRKRRVIDPCAKCPGCGARKGSIRYLRSRVVHCCDVCGAFWAELPRVVPHAWDFLARDEKAVEDSADQFRELFSPEPKKKES
jgi:hypothetical protein